MRAIALISEAREHGALSKAQAYEQALDPEPARRLGVDPENNHALAQQVPPRRRKRARVSRAAASPPAIAAEEFRVAAAISSTRRISPAARVARETKRSPRRSPRVSSRTAGCALATVPGIGTRPPHGADHRCALGVSLGRGGLAVPPRVHLDVRRWLPPVASPEFGDEKFAFGGGELIAGSVRRTQLIAMRVGRVIARVQVIEGEARRYIARHSPPGVDLPNRAAGGPAGAASARGVLACGRLSDEHRRRARPLARSRAARLLEKHPLLALTELPAALSTLGDPYVSGRAVARELQAQVRAHRGRLRLVGGCCPSFARCWIPTWAMLGSMRPMRSRSSTSFVRSIPIRSGRDSMRSAALVASARGSQYARPRRLPGRAETKPAPPPRPAVALDKTATDANRVARPGSRAPPRL